MEMDAVLSIQRTRALPGSAATNYLPFKEDNLLAASTATSKYRPNHPASIFSLLRAAGVRWIKSCWAANSHKSKAPGSRSLPLLAPLMCLGFFWAAHPPPTLVRGNPEMLAHYAAPTKFITDVRLKHSLSFQRNEI